MVTKIYNFLARLSPYVEVLLRNIYWKNIKRLGKYNPNKVVKVTNNVDKVEFDKLLYWLESQGIKKGDILIVHSGYDSLERTGLSPDEIIDRLLEFLGPSGTLVMPVIRRYKDLLKAKKNGLNLDDLTFKYNVKKTQVISGLLPFALMHRKDAVISRHPFNPLCAIGPVAKIMMENNLEGDAPSPHGANSAWKFCCDNGAKVCSIGTDIEHHNTIMHIVEEAYGDWYWPDDVWYDKYRFEIIEPDKSTKVVTVKNRKEEWGQLHLAEQNLVEAKKKNGIMISDTVGGIKVGLVHPQKMVDFLRARNKRGYPYFLLPFQKAKNIK